MFQDISEEEHQSLLKAIAQITVLIAGADSNIDTAEIEWATKLTTIRSYSYAEELKPYYTAVGESFDDDIKNLIAQLPESTEERSDILTTHLNKLNTILPKLQNHIAFKLYESFVSFAEHVAKASGGFMRFASISKEEKSLMTLPMLTPIILEIEEEES